MQIIEKIGWVLTPGIQKGVNRVDNMWDVLYLWMAGWN